MTPYFSFAFLGVLLPLTILAYALMPRRARWAVLLVASYVFFWAISGKLIVFVVASSLLTYACGLGLSALLERRRAYVAQGMPRKEAKRRTARWMKLVVVAGVLGNFGILVVLKYLAFFSGAATSLLALVGISAKIEVPSWGVPIGISFYTLMAVSYLVDVYRGTTKADRNPVRVALFLCFFPQIMEGPICRYEQTAQSLWAGNPVTRQNLFAGTLRILWGVAKKIIVADRLNLFVKPVFSDWQSYDGSVIALAAILYTVQLYCDFSGTMDVALGMGRIFGVTLPENFRQPFFSRTASEFWKRWHITLGAWFRDYVYYPVSLSAPMKRLTKGSRKVFGNRYGPLVASSGALFCVWLGNGLWHGAGSQYLFFGMYYFVLILLGGFLEPVMQRVSDRTGLNRDAVPYRAFQTLRTLVVIFVGELIFRAEGLRAGLGMLSSIAHSFRPESFVDGTVLGVGMDVHDYAVVCAFVLVMLCVGIARERGMDVSGWVGARALPIRWVVWMALVVAIVVLGAYGKGYVPLDPIYANF